MPQTIRIKHGRASAIVRGPSAAELEAMVRRAMGPAVEILERARDDVWDIAYLTWPVFSGASRKSFEKYLLIDINKYTIQAGMRSDLPAVRYIKSSKHNVKKDATRVRSPLQTDLRRPMADTNKAIASDLRDAVQRALTDEVRRG